MTILTALTQLYDRMQAAGEAPRPGFSTEKISFAVVIDAQGRPLRLADKRSLAGKKPAPVPMAVPAGSRTSGIRPNLLWDKTAYVFGVIAVEDESEDGTKRVIPAQGKRTRDEHAAFVAAHRELLASATDPGLMALRLFLEHWHPDHFAGLGFSTEALDQNVVFEFDDGTGPGFIHDRAAVAELLRTPSKTESGLCLVTGQDEPVERLHPKIKGVMGAQSSGASLVSFNNEAYESYGKTQGANAPVSEAAAFAYGTALNALLARDSERHLRVGDTTVAFWAQAPEAKAAEFSEWLMGGAFDPPDAQDAQNELRAALTNLAEGRAGADPRLDLEARIYMLGLAPNAARLSVRFWYPGRFGDFARHVTRFWEDLRLEPAPWKGPPAVWSLLYETAQKYWKEEQKRWELRKDSIPPLLGGQVMSAVLTGRPLPRMLLSSAIARVRADGDINGRRAAICKAVINETTNQEEIPVSLDLENTNPAYRLGRLFAVLERAQTAALQGLNATIKDRYFAAASATPARVFPLLVKNATHHLALIKKGESSGLGHWLEKELGAIWLGLGADMPRALTLEDQGRFIAGYYHQRWTKTAQTDPAHKEDAQ